MKRGKSATRPAKQEPIREYESDWVVANYWIKIGLARSQVKALSRLGKRWTSSKAPCAAAARLLISIGLLNEQESEAKLDALFR